MQRPYNVFERPRKYVVWGATDSISLGRIAVRPYSATSGIDYQSKSHMDLLGGADGLKICRVKVWVLPVRVM